MVDSLPYLDNDFGYISQFAAAPYLLDEMNRFRVEYNRKSILEEIYQTDLNAISRGLCLPATTGTCLNYLYRSKRFDESSIASMFRMLLPLHGAPANNPLTQLPYPNGWQIVSNEGDMYYHAIHYWVDQVTKGEIKSHSIVGYNHFHDLTNLVSYPNITIALSLDNSFVLHWIQESEQELGIQFIKRDSQGQTFINITGLDQTPFHNGRHVISLLDKKDDYVLISDSFSLPNMTFHQTIKWWPQDIVAKFTDYKTEVPKRAIIFSPTSILNPELDNLIKSFGITNAIPKQ